MGIACIHMLGDSESKRLKVAAPNLWEASLLSSDRPLPGKAAYPTASPLFPPRLVATQPLEGEGWVASVYLP